MEDSGKDVVCSGFAGRFLGVSGRDVWVPSQDPPPVFCPRDPGDPCSSVCSCFVSVPAGASLIS